MKFELPIMQMVINGLLLAIKMFWPVFLIAGAIILIKWIVVVREKRELAKSGIDQIDKMGGKSFEKYLGVLFEELGYVTERTRYFGDYGADLVTMKDGVKTVIQANRHNGKVGIKAVQEAVASKEHYGCARAMVVTNSCFTPQAKRLAASNSVDLWDRKSLAHAMNTLNLGIRPFVDSAPIVDPKASLQLKTIGDNGASCTACGRHVSEKVMEYCLNHDNKFGGKIYCYEHQRQF
jgi:restriction system protein